MSQTLAGKSTAAAVLEKAEAIAKENVELRETVTKLREDVVALKEKSVPQYPAGMTPGGVYGQIGASASINDGFSYRRLARAGVTKNPEYAKYELDVAEKLKNLYASKNFTPAFLNSMLVPYWTDNIPTENSAEERLVGELREKALADKRKVIDENEVRWLMRNKVGYREKDLSTLVDTQGGVLVGFPTLMELIDIQRNREVFAQAKATEVGLPANGRMQFPKLTNVTSAFWVGEGATITESTPATGYLDLQAKKLGLLVDFNNELLRFNSVAAEGMVRGDMAKVAALKADLGMLEGTGGTQIKGLITYDSAATWTTGTDKLIAYTVTSNLIQIKDAAEMEAVMPDTADMPTAWIMRRQLWAKISNRRADAVTVTDGAGQFLASQMRSVQERQELAWNGVPVVRSTQVSATRGNGSQTYVILGYFPDWIIARFGVLEFLASNTSDQAMTNDQTRLRCIQHIDAGARHASSFVFADAITIS